MKNFFKKAKNKIKAISQDSSTDRLINISSDKNAINASVARVQEAANLTEKQLGRAIKRLSNT